MVNDKQNKKRRFNRTSAANVFVNGTTNKGKMSWKLDVNGNVDFKSGRVESSFFFKRRGRQNPGARQRLFHYISAGGMGQLRRTTIDDLIEYRRRRFFVLLGALALFWLVFYILPSV